MLAIVLHAKRRIGKLFGIIPRGTQVDPALFPEDEYPVRCLNCGYDLRTLPDGRCPECGETFARGHLLVELYARERLPRGDRNRRIAWWLWAWWVIVSLASNGGYILAWRLAPGTFAKVIAQLAWVGHHWVWTIAISVAISAVAMGPPFLAGILRERSLPPISKRKAVLKTARAAAKCANSPAATAPSPAPARGESPDRSRTA